MQSHIGIKQLITAGGPTLFLLIGLSIYSLALLYERWTFYKKATKGLDGFIQRLRQALAKGDLKETLELAKRYDGPAGEVVVASLVGPAGKDERKRSTDRVLERQLSRLHRRLPFLGSVGSTAPFIGLFGTVVGVMRAFRDLAGAAGAGPGVVALGISEALIATAAGLFVAIPAVLGYNYFLTRSEQYANELRWLTDEILDQLTERR
ncbi:MAG: MotA/TolQ/ExbB proton channel family protein [Elusimicrobia bacterium]|nr:MotA/TolQ/ExbB proton channel family protein [Elusimicrobiota bacterium]